MVMVLQEIFQYLIFIHKICKGASANSASGQSGMARSTGFVKITEFI
jgi:hypothetical protein